MTAATPGAVWDRAGRSRRATPRRSRTVSTSDPAGRPRLVPARVVNREEETDALENRRPAVLVAVVAAVVAMAGASRSDWSRLTDVAAANPKATDVAVPNALSPELQKIVWARHAPHPAERARLRLHVRRHRRLLDPANKPVRFIAEGRDSSATIDSAYNAAGNGFQNEGDNEITGIFVSDGDPTAQGLLGAWMPRPFSGETTVRGYPVEAWRVFWTQQHGDNATYELVPSPRTPPRSGQ